MQTFNLQMPIKLYAKFSVQFFDYSTTSQHNSQDQMVSSGLSDSSYPTLSSTKPVKILYLETLETMGMDTSFLRLELRSLSRLLNLAILGSSQPKWLYVPSGENPCTPVFFYLSLTSFAISFSIRKTGQ